MSLVLTKSEDYNILVFETDKNARFFTETAEGFPPVIPIASSFFSLEKNPVTPETGIWQLLSQELQVF